MYVTVFRKQLAHLLNDCKRTFTKNWANLALSLLMIEGSKADGYQMYFKLRNKRIIY